MEQLLREEVTPDDRRNILALIAEVARRPPPFRKLVGFNCFEIILDADGGTATIIDVLDGSAAGTQRMTLSELADTLRPNPAD